MPLHFSLKLFPYKMTAQRRFCCSATSISRDELQDSFIMCLSFFQVLCLLSLDIGWSWHEGRYSNQPLFYLGNWGEKLYLSLQIFLTLWWIFLLVYLPIWVVSARGYCSCIIVLWYASGTRHYYLLWSVALRSCPVYLIWIINRWE